jgi:superoxide reductase
VNDTPKQITDIAHNKNAKKYLQIFKLLLEIPLMNRRTFLINSTIVASTTALGKTALADTKVSLPPENLIFTEQNGGIWQSKVRLHIPIIEVTGNQVKIRTEHGQSQRHHIVRHTLLLEDGTMVGATTFTPNDAPISDHELPTGYKGKIYATSFCNKHDLWLATATI